eukprot:scaffold473467_cov14-Prasinocladus_malaysianus.AAC.1
MESRGTGPTEQDGHPEQEGPQPSADELATTPASRLVHPWHIWAYWKLLRCSSSPRRLLWPGQADIS